MPVKRRQYLPAEFRGSYVTVNLKRKTIALLVNGFADKHTMNFRNIFFACATNQLFFPI